jgi:hypothetical protein
MTTTRIFVKLTTAERELLRTMAPDNASALVRRLILDEARRRGLPVPETVLEDTRGKYERNTP